MKKIFSILMLIIIGLSVSGCDIPFLNNENHDTDNQVNTVSLQVIGGTGSGEYNIGETVRIQSSIDNFCYWVDEAGSFLSYDFYFDIEITEDTIVRAVDAVVGFAYRIYTEPESNIFGYGNVFTNFSGWEYMYINSNNTPILSNNMNQTDVTTTSSGVIKTYTYHSLNIGSYLYSGTIFTLPNNQIVLFSNGVYAYTSSGILVEKIFEYDNITNRILYQYGS